MADKIRRVQLNMHTWLTLLGVLFCRLCAAQAEEGSSIELALVPTLGFNVSFPTFQKGYDKGYYSIDGIASCKDLYYGLGLQVLYNQDMQFTLRYAGSAIGGGYKTKPLYRSSGGYVTSTHTTSSAVNILDASIEKTLLHLKFFQDRSYNAACRFSGLVGMRYVSIVGPNRTDSLFPLNGFSTNFVQEESYEKQFRNGGVALSAGLSAQFYYRGHRSLKIGASYHLLLRPVFEYQYTVTSNSYANNIWRTNVDEFNVFAGRHQVLFFAEYPIRLLRIRY